MWFVRFVIIVGLLVPNLAAEDTAKPWAIEIVAKTPDGLGTDLEHRLKEAIRKSKGFRLTTKEEDRCIIRLRSYVISPGLSGYALVWTLQPKDKPMAFYLNSVAGAVVEETIEPLVVRLLALTDDELSSLSKLLR